MLDIGLAQGLAKPLCKAFYARSPLVRGTASIWDTFPAFPVRFWQNPSLEIPPALLSKGDYRQIADPSSSPGWFSPELVMYPLMAGRKWQFTHSCLVVLRSTLAYKCRLDGTFEQLPHHTKTFLMASKRVAASVLRRAASTAAQGTRPAGDISSVFPSLSGKKADILPQRFADLKSHYLRQNQDAIQESWTRLLSSLRKGVEVVKAKGSSVSNNTEDSVYRRLLTVQS